VNWQGSFRLAGTNSSAQGAARLPRSRYVFEHVLVVAVPLCSSSANSRGVNRSITSKVPDDNQSEDFGAVLSIRFPASALVDRRSTGRRVDSPKAKDGYPFVAFWMGWRSLRPDN